MIVSAPFLDFVGNWSGEGVFAQDEQLGFRMFLHEPVERGAMTSASAGNSSWTPATCKRGTDETGGE